MAKCVHCGKDSDDDAKFCSACGKPLMPVGATGCPICGNPNPEYSAIATPLVRVRLYLEVDCDGSRLLSYWEPRLDDSMLLPTDGEPIAPARYAHYALCYARGTLPFAETTGWSVQPVAWYAHISTVTMEPVHKGGFEINGLSAWESCLDVLRADYVLDGESSWDSLGPDGLPEDHGYTFDLQTLANIVNNAALCDELYDGGARYSYDARRDAFVDTITDDDRISLADVSYVVKQIIKGWE